MRYAWALITPLVLIATISGTNAETIYVSNEKDNSISIVDGTSLEVVKTIAVGQRPRAITLSASNKLAASQGATREELYRIALAANSYWFPDQYAKTALYFALFEGKAWDEVDPALILGPSFSSLSGWQSNVNSNLRLASFMSRTGRMGQGACAV